MAVTVQLGSTWIGNTSFSVINFFSFFTIQSNIFAAIVLMASGLAMVPRWAIKSDVRFDYLRGAATLYMTITGVIYILLLSHADVQTPLPWVNAILHYVFPLVMLADWVAFPPKERIEFRPALWWLAYPLVYGIYSLLRGYFAHWYPYPFISVSQQGYLQVLINCVLVAVFMLFLLQITLMLSRFRQKSSR
ncbi:Pr6Pr family membrane protein [Candidatus Saccharibacteria bacterium]|nr:Pr6Pr family membrane protein [Candidatus Saccharibacteria bacterium]